METRRKPERDAISRRALIKGSVIAASALAIGGRSVQILVDPIRAEATGSNIIATVAGGGPVGDGALATAASLSTPLSACVDTAGNLYIADSYFHRIRRVDAVTKIISTVAGSGFPGYAGDGGPATLARMTLPYDVVCDAAGNVFIADNVNSAIRRVDKATGIITTIAGKGKGGFNGDGIPASAAWLAAPRGVAMDKAGNLYIVDTLNYRVCVVNMGSQPLVVYPASSTPLTVQPGYLVRVAGNGTSGQAGDGGAARNANLGTPTNVAFDSKGNLYIGSETDPRVRMVDAGTGIITTIAGTGTPGLGGDGGPALQAKFVSPTDVALDSMDNLYIIDEDTPQVRMVNAQTKMVSTVVGWFAAAFLGDGGRANLALLNGPTGVNIDPHNNMYIADYNNARVRRVDAATNVITTVAGSSSVGDLGQATRALVIEPGGTALDAAGNLFIADQGNHRIRVVGIHGVIETIAGVGASGFSGDGGIAIRARLNVPCDVKIDAAGNLYIADIGNLRIRRVDARTGVITTIVGTGQSGFSGDNGPATAATLNEPRGIALDAAGNLYIADLFNLRVRFVNLGAVPVTLYSGPNALTVQPGRIITVVGTGVAGGSGDGGPGVKATINYPRGVAVDALGNLYVVEGGTGLHLASRVRKVDPTSGIITTVAGTTQAGYNGDNIPATSAELNGPRGVVVDTVGNLYIADTLNNRVRRVDARTQIMTTVVGTGVIGFSGEGGPASAAQVFYPRYVSLDRTGSNLYVSDAGNSRIRRVTLT